MISIYHIKIPKSNVWAKMENENPTGTHKDRSLGPWVDYYVNKGEKELVISSSGNSAISAAKFCKDKDIKLHAFVSPDDWGCEHLGKDQGVDFRFTSTPKKEAFRFAKEHNIPYLRASTDDRALVGYKNIAFELIGQLPQIDNIFVPTSSGATLEGIYIGFKEKARTVPALYVVQTTKVHPIASYFDKDFVKENESHAKAIVDNIAHRKEGVVKIAQETGGGGFVISNEELEEAREALQASNITGSRSEGARLAPTTVRAADPEKLRVKFGWQSVLSFAGFLKWRKENTNEADKQVSVCLFTD